MEKEIILVIGPTCIVGSGHQLVRCPYHLTRVQRCAFLNPPNLFHPHVPHVDWAHFFFGTHQKMDHT